jgi:CBS domain-containing protein
MPSVRDAMSTSIVSVPPSASVAEAATVMGSHAVGSVVVLHGERLVGIFTERDIVRALSEHFDAGGHLVQNWMSPEPVTVHPDANVEDALDLMLTKGFRHLPVLDDERLLGVVSLRDLGRYATGDHPT